MIAGSTSRKGAVTAAKTKATNETRGRHYLAAEKSPVHMISRKKTVSFAGSMLHDRHETHAVKGKD